MTARRATPLTARTESVAAAPSAEAAPPPPQPSPARDLAPTRRPSPSGIWVGLGVVAAGLAMIVLAWGMVAAEPDLVDQVAPLIAAGIGGLAVVCVGLALVNAAVARREEDDHRRQLAALAEVLDELRREGGR